MKTYEEYVKMKAKQNFRAFINNETIQHYYHDACFIYNKQHFDIISDVRRAMKDL